MNRTIANVIVDLAAALLFVGMIATGYILRFPLPPGTNRVLTLWGLTRHQWGGIHYWLSLGLLAAIGVHLVLHWKWIVTVIGKRLRLVTTPHPSMLRTGMVVTLVFVAAFGIFALVVHWSVREMAEPLHDLPSDQQVGGIDGAQAPPEATSGLELWNDVQAVFEERCVACHGPKRQLGGFRIDQHEGFFGEDDNPRLVVPGNAADSPLISIVSGARPGMRMADRHELSEQEVSLLSAWIDAGAAWPDAP